MLICQSEAVCEAMYFSEWYKLPKQQMTSLLLVMQRTRRPVVFTPGKYCTMTFDNFVTVSMQVMNMQASYTHTDTHKQKSN